jgi:hypothetical protein
MNKQPLWSENRTEDEIYDTDKETLVFNLLEDIRCLKEQLKENEDS